MTWYADEILLRATPAAVDALVALPAVSEFAYVVRDLTGHDWHEPGIRHGLPADGLLVIRPVCGSDSHSRDWYGTAVLEWAAVASADTGRLDSGVTRRLAENLDEVSRPPASFRAALAALARQLSQPVVFYSCCTFGGTVIQEFSLIYEPAESLFVKSDLHGEIADDGIEPLRSGLGKLELTLPTSYFAPHTRSFPWQQYRWVPR
jgi:hypothetical protein